MPDFYSIKLDVNEIKREIYFWNQQPSYINALHSDSIPNYIAGRKSIVGRREPGTKQICETFMKLDRNDLQLVFPFVPRSTIRS